MDILQTQFCRDYHYITEWVKIWEENAILTFGVQISTSVKTLDENMRSTLSKLDDDLALDVLIQLFIYGTIIPF